MQDQEHHGQGDHQHQAHHQEHLQPGEGTSGPPSTHGGGSVGAERSPWDIPGRGRADIPPSERVCDPTPVPETAAAPRMGSRVFQLKTAKLLSPAGSYHSRPDRTGKAPKFPILCFPDSLLTLLKRSGNKPHNIPPGPVFSEWLKEMLKLRGCQMIIMSPK